MMQATTNPQNLWGLWNEYWANDLLAMCECAFTMRGFPNRLGEIDLRFLAMAILFSQQISNVTRRLYRRYVGGNSVIVTASDFVGILELPSSTGFRWNQLLLNLGYAVQFPITTAFHPLVSRTNINDWTLFPRLPHLIGQITVFLIIDHGSGQFFARRYEEIFEHGDCKEDGPRDGASSALEVATDFTASGTTLVLAITMIQLSSRLRYFTGGLHFAAILCWLLVRTQAES